MNMRRILRNVLLNTATLIFFSCSNQSLVKLNDGDFKSNSYQKEDSIFHLKKDDLTNVYSKAIFEFIKASYFFDKTTYDTLFIGKRKFGQSDDFPEIELPNQINGTQIRLVSPEEGQIKQKSKKTAIYVNLIGWVDKSNADFLFVVFSNGFEHQYDYSIKFKFNENSQKYELDKIDYANYRLRKGQKPQLLSIFKEKKYVVETH